MDAALQLPRQLHLKAPAVGIRNCQMPWGRAGLAVRILAPGNPCRKSP
jgi:hypothetical protein